MDENLLLFLKIQKCADEKEAVKILFITGEDDSSFLSKKRCFELTVDDHKTRVRNRA